MIAKISMRHLERLGLVIQPDPTDVVVVAASECESPIAISTSKGDE